jgi:hypothetical protein
MYRFSMLDFLLSRSSYTVTFPALLKRTALLLLKQKSSPLFSITKLERFASCFFHSISLSAAV